ncbi:MAG TPA: glycerol-3-phosphate 1-O-acyltransferase PlsY [Tepidiformaceae bacterium]|jgi:glycerol-3-phosphate acyltransferase PlsY
MTWLANLAIGYILGSIPSGLVVGYFWLHRDIRESGSGATGATNVLRTAGRLPAVLVMVADILKGVMPAVLGRLVFKDDTAAVLGAGAAIAGHVWPVFAGFRGGRGVATAFGGILGLAPLVALVFPLVGLALVVPTRYVSLMSVVGTPVSAIIVAVTAALGWEPWSFAAFALFAVLVIEYRHIPNIRRLLAGTEPKFGHGGDRVATG